MRAILVLLAVFCFAGGMFYGAEAAILTAAHMGEARVTHWVGPGFPASLLASAFTAWLVASSLLTVGFLAIKKALRSEELKKKP